MLAWCSGEEGGEIHDWKKSTSSASTEWCVCGGGGGMCLRLVEGVGHAVEIGVGILDEDLLDNPPDGRTVGNMVVQASRHSRVQHGERVAVSREDQ